MPQATKEARAVQSRAGFAYEKLRDMALVAGPGAKLPTIRSLRSTLGVANTTLVEAFKGLEARGIVERVHGSGIYVREPVNQQNIGLVFGNNVFGEGISPFYSLLLDRCRERSESGNEHFSYYLDFGTAPPQRGDSPVHRDLVDAIESGKLDAIILVARHSPAQETWLRNQGLPVVSMVDSGEPQTVFVDYAELVTLGIDALVGQGCKRLGMISPLGRRVTDGWDLKNAAPAAFATALRQRGLRFEPDWMQFASGTSGGAPVELSAARAWVTRVLTPGGTQAGANRPDNCPDGVIVLNDMMTRSVVESMRECGIEPGRDVQIATHANKGSMLLGDYCDLLTKIEVDPADLVNAMFEMLETLLNGAPLEAGTVLVKPRLAQNAGSRAALVSERKRIRQEEMP